MPAMSRPMTARRPQENAMARNPAANAARLRFATLFNRHLEEGTGSESGEPWTDGAFASKVQSTRIENQFVSPRTISNWRKGKVPLQIEPILQALFGSSSRHAEAREELKKAFKAARAEKNAEVIRKAKQDPAGGTWVAHEDQFVLDRTVRLTDKRAAANPIQQQLQFAIRFIVEDLARRAMRLSNSQRWGDIATAANAFRAVACLDPL